jgi:NAD(P)-dependent dehydrogenase (short-subunit alcohol dehydrogenase family)
MATPKSKTKDGFESQFGINHIAHFALTSLLLPALLRSSTPSFNSRVINVSSSAHRLSPIHFDDINLDATGAYDPTVAYGQSKRANVLMANHLDRLYGPMGVHALSLHPGGIWTNLQAHIPADVMAGWKADDVVKRSMFSPEQGAATSVWAAVAGVWEGNGGKFLANCKVAPLLEDVTSVIFDGVDPSAFDEEGEKKLWELSIKLTGV